MTSQLKDKELVYCLEEGTCTDRAIKYYMETHKPKEWVIEHKKTFDDCLSSAGKHPGSVIFLPHIHALCKKLEYSNDWVALKDDSFQLQNPPLYLVKGVSTFDNNCAVLPTLTDLIKDKDLTLLDANNTQDAARRVNEKNTSFGVTNENGQKKYNLEIVEELKAINMLWIPFRYIGKQ